MGAVSSSHSPFPRPHLGAYPDPPAVFVYGTLRAGCGNDYLLRVIAQPIDWEPAVLPGAVLMGHNADAPFPYLVPVSDDHRSVRGELVTYGADWPQVLAALDHLEGYQGPGDPHSLYDRQVRTVQTSDGLECQAWVYEAGPLVARNRMVDLGGDWLRVVRS
jgi:gamma-glutamylcyclotransferase (GGCT)/AIG2-like uncharacterized protein YtfP